MSKANLRDIIAQEFVNALTEEKLPWHSMWATSRAYNAVNGKRYRGVNSLWLAFVSDKKGYTDPRWCTFKQAQENGWNVKKGEKATGVEFWSIYDKKQRKTISIYESAQITASDPSRKDDMRLISKQYSVFNAAQINGMPELDLKPCAVDIAAVRKQRDVLLKNMQLKFYEGGERAFYSPSTDSITMPPDVSFENTYAYMSTFLHECGHASGSVSRLNRPIENVFGSVDYAKEELRAEIASAFTSQALGFGAEHVELSSAMDNHKAYIQSWIEVIKDKPNELFAAIKDAEKISDYLLEKGEFELPEKETQEFESLESKISCAKAKQETQKVNVSEKVSRYNQVL